MASSKSILDSPRSRPSATRIIFQCLHSTDIQKFLREQYDVNCRTTGKCVARSQCLLGVQTQFCSSNAFKPRFPHLSQLARFRVSAFPRSHTKTSASARFRPFAPFLEYLEPSHTIVRLWLFCFCFRFVFCSCKLSIINRTQHTSVLSFSHTHLLLLRSGTTSQNQFYQSGIHPRFGS